MELKIDSAFLDELHELTMRIGEVTKYNMKESFVFLIGVDLASGPDQTAYPPIK